MSHFSTFKPKLLKAVLLVAISSIFAPLAFSQTLTGTIRDESGEPLAYATIYIEGTTRGTTSNKVGDYQLKGEAGEWDVVVKYIGYQTLRQKIRVQGTVRKNFVLKEEEVELEEVIITDDGKDPAYAIIRKAIDRKKENKIPYKTYRYDAYTKTVMRNSAEVDSSANSAMLEKLLGMEKGGIDSMEKQDEQIGYLEENVTNVYVRQPNDRKEEVVSTQVSGESGGYSFAGNIINRILDFSPYYNLIPFEGITTRGLVSPLSNMAMVFYDYKLLGTIKDKGRRIYKIQVIPKRKTDPVFDGLIYILDSTYAVRELDLVVTKDNQIQFFDTLRVQQEFVPLNDSVWVPLSMNYRGRMQIGFGPLTIGIGFVCENITRNYDVAWAPPKRFFKNEVIAFGDSATERDSAYWEAMRPVPLKSDEARDYFVKDSIAKVQSSPEYLDSLTRRSKKFRPMRFVFSGYSFRDYRRKTSWEIDAPIQTISFNPMEGWHFGLNARHVRDLEEGKRLRFNAGLRYGTSNRKFSWRGGFGARISRKTHARFAVAGGDFVNEFSDFEQVMPLVNMFYSLWGKKNFLALYQRKFGHISYGMEPFNGLRFDLSSTYEDRSALPVTTEYDWLKTSETYPENILFPRHQALFADLSLRIQIRNKYISTPDGKMNLGTKWPTLTLGYRKAFAGPLGSDVSYDRVTAGLDKSHRLGLFGDFSWDVSGGTFLTKDSVAFADRAHFKGNQTFIRRGGLRQFHLMQYYAQSTAGPWLEAHGQQAFGGFLLNKIPGIKKLRLNEYVGVHYLWTEEFGHYLEGQIGLEKRILRGLLPLRFDFHYRLLGDAGLQWGVTFTWFLGEDGGFTIGN